MNEPAILVATLGGQPQIISLTLDLLLARGEPIGQVIVVYTASGQRYRQAYKTLAGEFSGDYYLGRPIHLRSLPVRLGERTLEDAHLPGEVEAVRASFFSLLASLKKDGYRVHLSLSGGRRIMALVGLAAAQQYLTPADRVWHLYTSPRLAALVQDGQCMHLSGQGCGQSPPAGDAELHLVEVPFVPWAAYFPGLKPLLERDSPELPPPWQAEADQRRCLEVWRSLTPRQRDVLRLLARGKTRQAAARELGIAVTTLDSHREAILRKCADCWEGVPRQEINLSLVRSQFASFLPMMEPV